MWRNCDVVMWRCGEIGVYVETRRALSLHTQYIKPQFTADSL